MRAKHPSRTRYRRSGSTGRAKRSKATTYRLEPQFQEGLQLLGRLRGVSANLMVNEAVAEYLDSRTAAVQVDLEEILRRVKAYRKRDQRFESAIARFTEAEATLGGNDPVEGKPAPATGPVQKLVRDLIRD